MLCANNRIADSINRENVDALDAPKVEFTAAVTGMVNSGDKMAPERIVLCRGARVMSLVNSPQEGYVNGTQGTVTDAFADAVTVKFDGADEKVRIERHRWEINKSEAIVEKVWQGEGWYRVTGGDGEKWEPDFYVTRECLVAALRDAYDEASFSGAICVPRVEPAPDPNRRRTHAF